MTHWLEIIGTLVGLIYLYLEYRASIYLWIAGLIMPAIYVVVYYDKGLYADFAMQMYYILAGLYGIVLWSRGKKRRVRDFPITHAPKADLPLFAIVFLAMWVAIAKALIYFTDSTVPWLDAFTTAMSMVAMWLLARKHVEQWLAWIAVDVVSCGLYIYKELYFTSALYGLYTLVAVFGYRKWKQLMSANS